MTHQRAGRHHQRRPRSSLGWLVRFGYLPLMLVGFNGVGWWLAATAAPTWQVVALVVLAVAVSFAAERVLPYRAEFNRSMGDRPRDAAHAVVNETLHLLSLASLPLLVEAVAVDGAWPHDWPFVSQVLVSILVVDAGITLGHWLSHKVGLLWRFHAVHHSVKRFYGFNGLLKHPLHQLFETVLGTAPLILLGMPVGVATAVIVSVSVQLLLQHSNVDYAVGPLRRVLALNAVHRFHHLKWAGVGDVNFGLFTLLWDYLLRTATWDPEREFSSAVLGIAKEPDFPVSYGAQLLKPFRTAPEPAPAGPGAGPATQHRAGEPR